MKRIGGYSLLLAGLLLLLVACSLSGGQTDLNEYSIDAPAQMLDFPVGETSITWLPDDRLLIRPELASVSIRRPGEPIPYLLLKGQSLSLKHFPTDERCSQLAYHVSGVLPDGRLGLVQKCYLLENPNQGPTEEWTFVLAYDWETGRIEQLVADSIPPIGSLSFSWNPNMTRGVQEAGSLLSTIHWITPQGAEPMEVVIEDGFRRWSLADNYWRILSENDESRESGIACCGSWSPDGEMIAFFASSDAVGRDGINRATGEYKLYLMDANQLQPEAVLHGVYFPNHMHWSPNGRWLAFTGIREDTCPQDECLWLFLPEESELVLVTSDPIDNFSWSPDGEELATARDCEDCQQMGGFVKLEDGTEFTVPECDPLSCHELVIYDVSTVMAEP